MFFILFLEKKKKILNCQFYIYIMSKSKNDDEIYSFLPIVHELLKKFTLPDTTDKDITAIANAFNEKMAEAQKRLHATHGLELTESEQKKKIQELQEMIEQKQRLIDECTQKLNEWNQ